MDVMTIWTLAVVIGLTLATILLTGPGMWSEKWGWKWLERRRERKKPGKPGA